jgi:hypothetical protein
MIFASFVEMLDAGYCAVTNLILELVVVAFLKSSETALGNAMHSYVIFAAMKYIGVRSTPSGYQAYCSRQGKEVVLGIFEDAELAGQAHDCAAIKCALDAQDGLNVHVPLNDPSDTAGWTEPLLRMLKAQPWEEVVSSIALGAAKVARSAARTPERPGMAADGGAADQQVR